MTITEKIRYTSKIIKAGALLAETKTLLHEWDERRSVAENLARFRRENVFGKTSRARVETILAILRQRYLADPALRAALSTLAHSAMPTQGLDRICYLLALRNDLLLHDAMTDLLLPQYERGQHDITAADMTRWVRQQIAQGLTEHRWSEATISRVVRNTLATLRDFGVLHGKAHKQLAAPFLPLEAFCFIALWRSRELQSGERLLHDATWRLFFLAPLAVERLFIAAHQEHLLTYYAAGRVIRIEFPTASLEEYARALAQRAY